MIAEKALQKESAQTKVPQKHVRLERESRVNGLATFEEKSKEINGSHREVSDSNNNVDCLSAAGGSLSGPPAVASELDVQISLFSSVRKAEPESSVTIRNFIRDVKNGRWKEQVAPLQKLIKDNKRKEYNEKKPSLPVVTLSALCKSRAGGLSPEEKEVVHSGFLQADFDLKDNTQLANAETLQEIRQQLLSDPHVGAVFCGPSGEGIKAVVQIDGKRHSDSWLAAETYYFEKYGLKLDKATKDHLRLCFVSYDPLAEVSEEFSPLPIPKVPEVKKPGQKNWYPPTNIVAGDIREMLTCIPPRRDYNTWMHIISAVGSALPMEEACEILKEWSPEEEEGEYAYKLRHPLTQISIGTLVHIAKQHGYKAKTALKRDGTEYLLSEGSKSDPAPEEIISEYDLPRERVIDALHNGQTGDAKLWADIRRGLWVWNIQGQIWMIYEKGIWRRDEGNTTPMEISDTLCRVYDALIASLQKEISENPAPEAKIDSRAAELKKLTTRRKVLTRHDYLKGVEKLAAMILQLPAAAFDANTNLLVTQNCTLDLATCDRREHRSSDYLTRKCDFAYDPYAKCPKWEKFINDSMAGDQEKISFLRRVVGYSLTDYTDQDVLFFCYGEGANGKSTFFSGLGLLFGDLMITVSVAKMLGDNHDNSQDYYKASMQGYRLVKTDEIPEGKRLGEHHIKALIGGDDVSARQPFGKYFEYTPKHKIWMPGNHKLEIRGTDHGIWRRIYLIPWTVVIPEDKRRPRHEILAEFKKELPGILNWAIYGLLEMKALGGLKPPKSVLAATEEYRLESDQMARFLEECTVCSPTAKVKLKRLLPVYNKWREENGERPRYDSSQRLSKYFKSKGYEVRKEGHDNAVSVFGIGLLANKNDWDLNQNEAELPPEALNSECQNESQK